jgi:very-short-patch-repair endonuclease
MKGQTNSFVLDNRLQRALRHNMTEAEKALWQRLRGKQLSGYKFRRQHPFGDFVLDFVCLEAKLVIEVDGGQHVESNADLVRDAALESAGFRVLRFWNNQVLGELDAVVEKVWAELGNPSPP